MPRCVSLAHDALNASGNGGNAYQNPLCRIDNPLCADDSDHLREKDYVERHVSLLVGIFIDFGCNTLRSLDDTNDTKDIVGGTAGGLCRVLGSDVEWAKSIVVLLSMFRILSW